MYFRNLIAFRFNPQALPIGEELDARLEEARARPIGPLEMFTRGFVSPFGGDTHSLTHTVAGRIWIAVGGEDKILPPSVVNAEAARRAAEIEEREGRKLGGRARRKLKDDVLQDLLPVAFSRPRRVNAYIDHPRGLLVVDTSSRKVAESVASELRRALGSFPALPLNAEVAPCSVLTAWIAGDAMPEGLSIGDEAELRDPIAQGAKARLTRQELQAEEVAKHLESGKQCARLAVNLGGHLSMVLGEDLVVRKLRFLDGAVEGLEETDREGQHAELDARFALMTGELAALWDLLDDAFKLSKVQG